MGTCNEKILVINSEIEINQLLQNRLTLLGYDVFSTLDTKTALMYIAKELFDLVIIDVILSKSGGYEMCRKIREISKVPIILLGSLDSITSRVMALDLGADEYIIKPFSPKDKKSNKYEEGVSCPRCYDTLSNSQKTRFRMRQNQINLAKKAGRKHKFQKEF